MVELPSRPDLLVKAFQGVKVKLPPLPTEARIRQKCNLLADVLIAKNASYGDTAIHPVNIFAKGKATDLIRARIDDKLSRIKTAPDAFGEDAILDLLGYLVLLQLAVEDERAANESA